MAAYPLVSMILWGTNFENQLKIGRALYDITTDRVPRKSSRWAKAPGGIPDAYIPGYDYYLWVTAKWLPDGGDGSSFTPVSGATGWQAFIDWARQMNAFRFVPDASNPYFYVDSCYLDSPLDGQGGGLGKMDDILLRDVPVCIYNAYVDFHVALRGLMFEYVPGGDLTQPLAATVSRASAGTYRGVPGQLGVPVGASAANNVLRDRHYIGSTRGLLLEGPGTQLVSQPESFSSWNIDPTETLTSGKDDPFGGTNAYLIDSDGHGIHVPVTFTGDGVKAFSVFMRFKDCINSQFGILDNGVTWRPLVNVTWSTAGVPALSLASGTGTLLLPENYGNGWWRLSVISDSITAAHTNTFYIYANAGTGGTKAYAFGANAWDTPFPQSYQGPSLSSRSADDAGFQFGPSLTGYVIQPMTVYCKCTILYTGGLIHSVVYDPYFVSIHRSDLTGNAYYLYSGGSGGVQSEFQISGNAWSSSLGSGVYTYGDVMEVRGVVKPDGSLYSAYSKNGGAEVVSSVATVPSGVTAPMGGSWGAGATTAVKLYINRADEGKGFCMYHVVRVLFGEQSMATCRAA